ncbi:unnamed protein product, partial [Mesorhabditis spiculigera]
MVHYKLHYFWFNGLGEPIRQLFAMAKVDYEDHRVHKDIDWPELKKICPFGQVPVLEVDGKILPQSRAVTRYLARKFGFAGQTEWEQAQVDAWADQLLDFMFEVRPFLFKKIGFTQGDADAEFAKVAGPARDKLFPLIVKQLKENGTGYLVGNKVSWADLYLNYHAETFRNLKSDYLANYPEIEAHLNKVREIPELKEWIEKRPKNHF